jgi:hypothetical protein
LLSFASKSQNILVFNNFPSQPILESQCWQFLGANVTNGVLNIPPSTAVRSTFITGTGTHQLTLQYSSTWAFNVYKMDQSGNIELIQTVGADNNASTTITFQANYVYAIYIEAFDASLFSLSLSGSGASTCNILPLFFTKPISNRKANIFEINSYSNNGTYHLLKSIDGKKFTEVNKQPAVKGKLFFSYK